jgi:hypothetical protein
VPGLDIEFAFDDLGCAEGTLLWLVANNGGKEVYACFVQEISDLLHIARIKGLIFRRDYCLGLLGWLAACK